MKNENWELLNGQGFGERVHLPSPLKGNACGDGIEIPEFMRNYSYNGRVGVPVSAYCGRAMGRERARKHQQDKARRDMINGLFYCFAAFGVLVFVVNLAELVCR